MSSKHATAKAFTLVELLVVIAIISVLAALLLPALKRAGEQAIGLQCLSNSRQAYLYLSMYANDHRGVIPQGWSGGTVPPSGTWIDTPWINFYKGSSKRYADLLNDKLTCPRNSRASSNYPFAIVVNSGNRGEFSTTPYGIYLPSPSDTYRFRGFKLSALTDRSGYALIVDSAMQDGSGLALVSQRPQTADGIGLNTNVGPGGQRRAAWIAHGPRANAIFADGHGQSLTAKQLQTETSNTQVSPLKKGIYFRWDQDGIRRSNTLP